MLSKASEIKCITNYPASFKWNSNLIRHNTPEGFHSFCSLPGGSGICRRGSTERWMTQDHHRWAIWKEMPSIPPWLMQHMLIIPSGVSKMQAVFATPHTQPQHLGLQELQQAGSESHLSLPSHVSQSLPPAQLATGCPYAFSDFWPLQCSQFSCPCYLQLCFPFLNCYL